ncbi:MAG: hypothetical protein WD558_09380, partial [Pseudomonadales bacterium]
TNNQNEVRFVAPAYDGEILTIDYERAGDRGETGCLNVVKTCLATMTGQWGSISPHPASEIAPAIESLPRRELTWHRLNVNAPAPAYFWQPNPNANRALAEQISDDLKLYRGERALVHPLAILRQCNAVFNRTFIIPAWIHAGSKVTFHTPLIVGETVEIRLVPIEKWKKKGHEFVKLYIAFLVKGETRVEVEHTAIFKIAPPDKGYPPD